MFGFLVIEPVFAMKYRLIMSVRNHWNIINPNPTLTNIKTKLKRHIFLRQNQFYISIKLLTFMFKSYKIIIMVIAIPSYKCRADRLIVFNAAAWFLFFTFCRQLFLPSRGKKLTKFMIYYHFCVSPYTQRLLTSTFTHTTYYTKELTIVSYQLIT